MHQKTVLITGASAGIGLATARAFAAAGASLVLGARRKDQLDQIATQLQAQYGVKVLPLFLDVRRPDSCETFIAEALHTFGRIDVLVNNAGLARGMDKVVEVSEADMQEVFETNVYGLLRLSKLALKTMLAQHSGHIVNLGSVAGHQPYEGGSLYCASKFSVRAISEILRLELLGTPIRVTLISPGLVETEFSLVRFRGDAERAGRVYRGFQPLTGDDIANCIVFAVSCPPHVNIDEITVRPVAQAGLKVHRTE